MLICLIAGIFVLGSSLMGFYEHLDWFIIMAFVARNAHDYWLDRLLPCEYYTSRFGYARALSC